MAVLCPRFAIIRDGRLIANTTPGEAREAIEGTIYEGTISAEYYERLLADPRRARSRRLIWSRAGTAYAFTSRTETHRQGFDAVPATLEDAYWWLIKTGRSPGSISERPPWAATASSTDRYGLDRAGRVQGGADERVDPPGLRRFRTVLAGDLAYHSAGRCSSSGP